MVRKVRIPGIPMDEITPKPMVVMPVCRHEKTP
jgi:hypothetical protein